MKSAKRNGAASKGAAPTPRSSSKFLEKALAVDPQPVGTVIKVPSQDLSVLKALNEALLKTKSNAFDQILGIMMQASQAASPLDQEYRKRAKEALESTGASTEGERAWTFILEDGTFTRTK